MALKRVAAAICLSGGRARRFGGVPKSLLIVDGQSLLIRTLHALQEHGASPIIVVGPEEPMGSYVEDSVHTTSSNMRTRPHYKNQARGHVEFHVEDPPYSGPAWALAAGVAALDFHTLLPDDLIAVVSVDLPFLGLGLATLLQSDAVSEDADHTLGITASGQKQWLLGTHRWDALRSLTSQAQPNDSLKAIFSTVHPRWVTIAEQAAHDIDTPEDLAAIVSELNYAENAHDAVITATKRSVTTTDNG